MPSCFEKHSRSSLKRWRNWGSGIFGDHEINQQVLMRLGVDESRIRVIPEVVDNTWRRMRLLGVTWRGRGWIPLLSRPVATTRAAHFWISGNL